ncbi:hypothetical protein [Tomitella fengzijianii]|uniref:hypothetical protein n=1 Tax=Tomitella fengzijianii TaxID=2597660 RepID=UPI00131C80AE|nr:hypothetical protein [Tomitella fengzijianii]
MLTDSLTNAFGVFNTSIENGTGSIGALTGDGIGSLGDILKPFFAGLETMSGAGE